MIGMKKIFSAALLTAGLSGCTALDVTSHAVAIDHSATHTTNRAPNDISHDRGSLKLPRYQHTSIKGDASKALSVAGQEHFRAQNYGLAKVNFEKAVEQSSDNASAWLGLAASYDQLGQFKSSDRAYKQLLQLRGNSARVLNNIGYSYLLRGDYSKARQYLNRAQNMDPQLEEVQGNIHLLEKTLS